MTTHTTVNVQMQKFMDDVCLNLGRVHQEAFLTGRTHHEDVSLISKFVDVYSYVIIALLFPNDWTPAEGQFIAKLESVLENTGCDDFFFETGSQYQSRKFNHLNGMRSNAIVINMSCYELWQEHNIPHVYSAWFMWSELFPEVVYKMTTFEHQVCTMHRSGVFPLPTDAMERLNQVILNESSGLKIKAFLMASPPLAGTLLNPTKFRRLGRPVG